MLRASSVTVQPRLRGVVVNEETTVGAGQHPAVRGLIQRAHEVAFGAASDTLNSRRLRVEAADASICAKPDDALAVDEDRIDVIRTQSSGGAVESETLSFPGTGESEYSMPVRSHPNLSISSADSTDRPRRSVNSKQGCEARCPGTTRFLLF